MPLTLGTLGHGAAAIAWLALTVLLVASRQRGRHGALLILASALSLGWAANGLLARGAASPGHVGTALLELAWILAWGFFVHALIRLGRHALPDPASEADPAANEVFPSPLDGWRYPLLALALLVAFGALWTLAAAGGVAPETYLVGFAALLMIAALAALVLVEELYRHTVPERRYAIRYLCTGLGLLFAFDFLVFTDTLLFRRLAPALWESRAFVHALVVPLLALSIARSSDWALRLHVSRNAATGSAVVLGAGIYLLVTALVGTLIGRSGVSGAEVLAATVVLIALGGLAVLGLSARLRAQVRVLVSKHLFSYKYDYRREWLKFTDTLARDPDEAPAAILEGLTAIVESEAGALWGKRGDGYELIERRGFGGLDALDPALFASLERFLRSSGWLIDLDELRAHPERYEGLELPAAIADNTTLWLIVPLPFRDEIVGFALIARSRLVKRVNWEDRDLLKTAGHQAAVLLAQRRANEALTEARQFEAYSKLSAYIVHDLKNILGQQSLIVSNAAKHKHKPAFVDDAIETIENSVTRMHALLEQLRLERDDAREAPLELAALVADAAEAQRRRPPAPTVEIVTENLSVRANRAKMVRVFGHLIQNAQEATSASGHVSVRVLGGEGRARIEVADDGHGMDERFLRTRLFRPFESTKGLTGMGIGIFESREYVRSLGGDITVASAVGRGTTFTVVLPLAGERAADATATAAEPGE